MHKGKRSRRDNGLEARFAFSERLPDKQFRNVEEALDSISDV